MAKIKAYTDLEQSKRLAKILPLDSADMRYGYIAPYDYSDRKYDGGYDKIPYPKDLSDKIQLVEEYASELPCWSLAALLGILETVSIEGDSNKWTAEVFYYEDGDGKAIHDVIHEVATADNPLDACVDLIIKYEQGNRH